MKLVPAPKSSTKEDRYTVKITKKSLLFCHLHLLIFWHPHHLRHRYCHHHQFIIIIISIIIIICIIIVNFFVTSVLLYLTPCLFQVRRRITIRGCVRPSVRRSVRRSVTPSLRGLLGPSYAEYLALFMPNPDRTTCKAFFVFKNVLGEIHFHDRRSQRYDIIRCR